MTTFKAGDKVTLVNSDSYANRSAKAMKKLANNTLVVHRVSSDGSVVFAGLLGKKEWPWHSKDLALVFEDQAEPDFIDDDYSYYMWALQCPEDAQSDSDQDTPIKQEDESVVAESPEQTQFQKACDLCNPGDKIMIVAADSTYPGYKREMLGTVQTVISISAQTKQPIHSEIHGQGIIWAWMPDEVRLATPEEIRAAKIPQFLRRGELVRYKGEVCVIFSEGADRSGDYAIASLTGDPDYYWVKIDELIPIGSIRKNIKQAKKLVRDWK